MPLRSPVDLDEVALIFSALFKMFLNILLKISVLMTTRQMCAAPRRGLPKNILGWSLEPFLSSSD